MNARVLITYATRAGSTVGVATAIGDTLMEGGYAVDVVPVKKDPALNGYDIVLMGSAVRYGRWLPEAVEYAKANQAALARTPVAVFSVHMPHAGDAARSSDAYATYHDQVRPLVTPVAEGFFAGAIDPAKLSLLARVIVKGVKAPVGDFRDWSSIRAWAEALPVEQPVAG